MVEIDSRKASLIAEIEVSRGEMRGALRRCKAHLDPVVVMRRSVREHSAAWISGAALVGWGLSQWVRLRLTRSAPQESSRERAEWRERSVRGGAGSGEKGHSWLGALVRFGFELLRPALAEWATERLMGLARAQTFTGPPHARNGIRPGTGKNATSGEFRA